MEGYGVGFGDRIMIILNPTDEQLESWYRCDKKIANFLISAISPIHVDEKGDEKFAILY